MLLSVHAHAGERRKRGKSDRRSQELSLVIKAAMEQTVMVELLPRTQIDVYVQVMHSTGSGGRDGSGSMLKEGVCNRCKHPKSPPPEQVWLCQPPGSPRSQLGLHSRVWASVAIPACALALDA